MIKLLFLCKKMALIEVRDLEKKYVNEGVETLALSGVSFTVEAGEFVAVMGPSGSGKSTLLHLLGFLDEETGGKDFFAGKTFRAYARKDLARVRNKRMGFIFQAFNLLGRTSVFDNVKLPLLYSDVPEAKWSGLVEKAIADVEMSHRIYHDSSQLSGGEKQRVAIARALINNPEVVFADEPTGNLDSKTGQIIMKVIQELSLKHGCTVILVTHENYTAEYAERVIFMRDGKIASDTGKKERRGGQDHFSKFL